MHIMQHKKHCYELEPYLYSVYNTFGEPSDQGHQDLYAYYAAQKTLDSALSAVLENLSNRGLLEDTVIIIFGDHYPYGLSDDGQTLLFGDDVDQPRFIGRYSHYNFWRSLSLWAK